MLICSTKRARMHIPANPQWSSTRVYGRKGLCRQRSNCGWRPRLLLHHVRHLYEMLDLRRANWRRSRPIRGGSGWLFAKIMRFWCLHLLFLWTLADLVRSTAATREPRVSEMSWEWCCILPIPAAKGWYWHGKSSLASRLSRAFCSAQTPC